MKIELNRINNAFHFEGINEDGLSVAIDANKEIGGEGKGIRPMQMVLMGLAACASIDVILILNKQKQTIENYKVTATAERATEPPKDFKKIDLHFFLKGDIKESFFERAIDLAINKYCSVAQSLDKKIKINTSFEIIK